jgi:hypothetical protein
MSHNPTPNVVLSLLKHGIRFFIALETKSKADARTQEASLHMYYRELNGMEQRLVAVMRKINFGRLENLVIEDGHAKTTATSRKISTANFEREETPHAASRPDGDFILTDKHVRFLRHLRKVGNGRINSISIRAGLPVSAEIEEAVASI